MFSLVIPSINRPNFLKQYVDFLEYQNFDGEVIIGDSSNDENYKIFEEYYKSKKLPFRITHLQKKNKDHFYSKNANPKGKWNAQGIEFYALPPK